MLMLYEIEYVSEPPIQYLYVALHAFDAVQQYGMNCRSLGELKPGDREEVVVREYPLPVRRGEVKPVSGKPKRYVVGVGEGGDVVVEEVKLAKK